MSSKRELREQMALLRGDVEAWRDTAVRFAASRDAAVNDRDAVFAELAGTRKQRDAAVDAQYVDRAELVEAGDMVAELVDERNAALERVAKLGDIVSDLRARVAELEAAVTTPEPRPFRVGDRVAVAPGATFKVGSSGPPEPSSAGGRVGVVRMVWGDGDLTIDTSTGRDTVASPEFCTLIEPAPDDDTDDDTEPATADPAAEQAVRIHLADGQVLEVPGALVEIDGEWWVTSLDDESPRAWLNLEHVAVVVVR